MIVCPTRPAEQQQLLWSTLYAGGRGYLALFSAVRPRGTPQVNEAMPYLLFVGERLLLAVPLTPSCLVVNIKESANEKRSDDGGKPAGNDTCP